MARMTLYKFGEVAKTSSCIRPELLLCAVTLDHHPSAELPITGCYRRIEPKELLRPEYAKAKSNSAASRPPAH